MYVFRIAWLFLVNAIWRITGFRGAGRELVRALGSKNSDECTVAGMFLVQAGERSKPLLHEALQRREHVAMILRILADIGDSDLQHQLEGWITDNDPAVVAAARDALKILRRHQRTA